MFSGGPELNQGFYASKRERQHTSKERSEDVDTLVVLALLEDGQNAFEILRFETVR